LEGIDFVSDSIFVVEQSKIRPRKWFKRIKMIFVASSQFQLILFYNKDFVIEINLISVIDLLYNWEILKLQ
jgi:hypothetical protein